MRSPAADPKAASPRKVPPMQFGTDQVLWAAWLYYEEGLKQEQIADQLGISRASVFNLLQKARDEGVVSITIDPTRIGRANLALDLRDKVGLEECFVLPTGASSQPLAEQIGHLAARLLESRIKEDEILGVAWGRTVLALSQALTPLNRPHVTVAQLTGSSAATMDFSPVFCTSNIAEKLHARCVNLHAPGVVSTAQVKDILMAEPAIREHFELLGHCTTILFGVTQLTGETLLVSGGFMTKAQLAVYRDLGAVGFASGHFFDAAGRLVTSEFDDRHITMSAETMMQVPQRICVGGGAEKVEAIAGMIRARLATVRVTDAETARALLAQIA
jgi:DNA-binding transcriptional regulator LsrR (DeoR family)